jgi:ATP-dependent DNA helicase RecG
VVLAPTEILATQHYQVISKLLAGFDINCILATRTHTDNLDNADVIIGTHAILHRQLPNNVGLVIIDEQHRFGVRQRGQLIEDKKTPHLLSMTATPIPRTIALTLYTELDMSIIDELPHGRLPLKTWVVPASKRSAAYRWISQQIKEGGQAFVVCPLIESSDSEAMSEIKSVEIEYHRLTQEIFPELRIGLVHGRMKTKEKDAVIQKFASKQIDILVATPVVEVGIDIPGATIMMIEGAERFGLAGLHQLRGRVGRNNQQGYCLLFSTSNSSSAINRLTHLESIQSGHTLAELDLKLRGPGNLYGIEQSGYLDLKIASLQDGTLIQASHTETATIIKTDPSLVNHPLILEKLHQIESIISQPN